MGSHERKDGPRDLCGRCGRIAEAGEDGGALHVVSVQLSVSGAGGRSTVPLVLCGACHGRLLRREGDPGGGAVSPEEPGRIAEKVASLFDEPMLAALLPVVGTGGRAWDSFRFACANCPATIREGEAHARLIPGGGGEAQGIDVAAVCGACGCVTPYQVVFRDDALPRFHQAPPVRDPRAKEFIPR